MQIFLVEDNRGDRKAITKALESLGHTVDSYNDTSESTLENALSSKADLFILDIELEYTTAGLDFAKRLTDKKPTAKFIYLTSKQALVHKAISDTQYPTPENFVPKEGIGGKGFKNRLEGFLVTFEAKNCLTTTIFDLEKIKEVFVKDIVCIEKDEYKVNFYMINGDVLKDHKVGIRQISDPNDKRFISTLTIANKDNFLVNQKLYPHLITKTYIPRTKGNSFAYYIIEINIPNLRFSIKGKTSKDYTDNFR